MKIRVTQMVGLTTCIIALSSMFAYGDEPVQQANAKQNVEQILQTGFEEECLNCDVSGGLLGAGGPFAADAGYPTVKLSGFFQADAVWFQQDATNQMTVGDIQDGADFRRARLSASGKVAENVAYMIEFDFAFSGRPSFMDVWMEIQDVPVANNLKIGQYRNPFGLDGLTSVKELTFIERGLPFAFLPFRQIGVMSSGTTPSESSTWAVSGFRFPTDAFGGQIGDDGGYGVATRLTHLLAEDHEFAVHIGGAYSGINPGNNAVRYRNQPEIFVAETGGAAFVPGGVPNVVPPFVDTGVIPTDFTNLFSAELAATAGPVHAQGEFVSAIVDRTAAGNVAFYGVSGQVAWILTGEHRPYNKKSGVLSRIVPNAPFGDHGIGAWEVAARYSYLDLDDDTVQGGTLGNLTLGMNWYLNKYTKFQLNYIHAMLDNATFGESDANIVGVRGQLDF